MKRIDRLCQTARHEAGMSALFFFAAIAAGVWAVVGMQSGGFSLGGVALWIFSTIALCLSMAHLRECLRVSRLAMSEMDWEARR